MFCLPDRFSFFFFVILEKQSTIKFKGAIRRQEFQVIQSKSSATQGVQAKKTGNREEKKIYSAYIHEC